MSVCGQTEEESGSEEPGGAGSPLRDMYEQKAVSKVVRVLTVLAYLLSVSLAAILLSVYYVCVWQSPKLPLANDTADDGSPSALLAQPPAPHSYTANTTPHYSKQNNHTRGGDSTVSEAVRPPPAALTSRPPSEPPEPPDPPPEPLYDRNATDYNATEQDATTTPTDNVTVAMVNATDQR